MVKRLMYVIGIMMVLVLSSRILWSVELQKDVNVIIPDRVSEKITVDGELNEAVWQQQPINETFRTLFPIYGRPFELETRVWAAYDKGNLYFAFKCFDPEPNKIKATIAQRDKISNDDHFAVMLDTVGTKQSSYEFYVNPNGIQADAINSAVSGSDSAPDFVWESAGKLTADGYQGEMRIPLESVRYQPGKGKQVRMGVLFYRSVPHLGTSATWPELAAGQPIYNFMATVVYKGLKSGLKLEILPNFTYSWNSDRQEADTWDRTSDTNIGVGIKYGITTSITAEATVNPDFSQVESDVFQMEFNRRYPVFYSEKRPFFMESKDVLDFSVIKESMMILPIHTRFIADPSWALKLSGSARKLNFAFLAADERSAGQPWLVGVNPNEGKSALFGIFRAKLNLGSDNTLGVLYSGRHFVGERNDVAGVDLKYRFSRELRATLSYLYSATRTGEGEPLQDGGGLNAMMQYTSSSLIVWGIYERYDNDFYMATAFQNRVGISRGAGGFGPIFKIKLKGIPWLKRIIPFAHYYRLYDLGTRMTDVSREFAVNFGFSPWGELNLEYWHEDEAWAGRMFDKKYFHSVGYIQLFKWLQLFENIVIGEQIYYHPTDPFLGTGKTIELDATVEPGMKLKLGFSYLYSDLKTREDKQKVYSINIYNLHTTYQFNKYFFLRGIIRYDDLREKLLTDFLASFTLIPGTVVHLGYGSLHLRNQWQDGMWIPGQGDLLMMKQGLFFKASYLWRVK